MKYINKKKRNGVSALFKTIAVAALAFRAELANALPMLGPGTLRKTSSDLAQSGGQVVSNPLPVQSTALA